MTAQNSAVTNSVPERAVPSELPDHLVKLPGGEWAMWRCIGLRGAGFPAAPVLKLSSPGCAEMADRLLRAGEELDHAREEARAVVSLELDRLREAGEWEGNDERAALLKASRLLKSGKVPVPAGVPERVRTKLDALKAAGDSYESHKAGYAQLFGTATTDISHVVAEVVHEDRFLEAIIWQNRRAFHTGIAPLLRRSAASPRSTKQRQHEEMVASYLQRSCLKNDTIGFFGPVGWANFDPHAEAVREQPGATLLAVRNVYFEVWGMDVLAKTLTRDNNLLPWIAPRRMPNLYFEGRKIYGTLRGTIEVSQEHAAILHECDGEKVADEIAAAVIASPDNRLTRAEEVYQLLEALRGSGMISWALEVPMELYPERTLRRMIERIKPEGLRSTALNALLEMEASRATVAAAAGDAKKLDQALAHLEATFTRLTGEQSTRSAGKTYAARTLVYEDCRRDIKVEFGPELLESLGPPLSLLLTSARWLTSEAVAVYGDAFRQIHAELAGKTGSGEVSFLKFWARAQRLFYIDQSRLADGLLREFQKRWAEVLALPEGRRRVDYTVEELRPKVTAAFAAPQAGWSHACYHSPDLMIAASSAEAIRRGEYQLVLGELHVGANTLGWPLFIAQHPAPETLFEALERDQPEPRLATVVAKSQVLLHSARLIPGLISPKDFRLIVSAEPSGVPEGKAITIGELLVEQAAGGLVARTRDGRQVFALVEVLADAFMWLLLSRFKMMSPAAHTPRVSFDRLVVSRETWCFAPGGLAFAYEKDEAARFVAARRWAQSEGLPRFIFVKSSAETKPFYVDFDSPIYVNIFARAVRRAADSGSTDAQMVVSEMLPSHEQSWLSDAEGQHYTSELRMVAVDLTMPR